MSQQSLTATARAERVIAFCVKKTKLERGVGTSCELGKSGLEKVAEQTVFWERVEFLNKTLGSHKSGPDVVCAQNPVRADEKTEGLTRVAKNTGN